MLDISAFNRSSLWMWADYLTKARAVGNDINPAARTHAAERMAIEIGDASDPTVLPAILRNTPMRPGQMDPQPRPSGASR